MKCQNCSSSLKGKYCHECGQKAAIKRFSNVGLFSIDLFLGLFSFEKSKFLKTTKALILSPGSAVREYLNGKRIKYFHFLTYLIVIITLNQIIISYFNIDFLRGTSEEKTDLYGNYFTYANQHFKLFALIKIPLGAIVTFLLFRKSKLNFAEHLVINTYLVSIEWILKLIYLIPFAFIPENILPLFKLITSWITRIYAIYFIYQIFNAYYNNKKLLLLGSLITMLLVLVAYVFFVIYPMMIILK